jgi:hypothetical protein
MSTILLENYIKFLIENESKNWVRTDLPAYSEEEISPAKEKVPDFPKKKESKRKKSFLKILLALAATTGGVGALVNNADIQSAKKADSGDVKSIQKTIKKINDIKSAEYTIPSITWKTSDVVDDSKEFTKSKEVSPQTGQFVAIPYYDNGNVSVGFGTNIDRAGKKGKESDHPNLNSNNTQLRNAAIIKATKLIYDSYGIEKQATSAGINQSDANRIFAISYNDHIRKLMRSSPWLKTEATPSIVELVAYDMGYNVGPGVFSKEFKKAGAALRSFVEMLEIYSQTKDAKDLESSLQFLTTAIEEIKDSNAYRNPKASRDNAVASGQAWWETRFERHTRLLNDLLESLQNGLNTLTY